MPSIDLDVHRDFCEVAIFEDGKVTRHPGFRPAGPPWWHSTVHSTRTIRSASRRPATR